MHYEIDRVRQLSERVGVSLVQLLIHSRQRAIADRRAVVMWYLRWHDCWSLHKIEKVMRFDHSTVLWNYNKVMDLLKARDRDIVELVKNIQDGD